MVQHHDLPQSLRKKLSVRSLNGAIPLPMFLNASAYRLTAFISGSGQSDRITAGIRRRIYWMRGPEILRLKAQLKRTEEERDILKKAARYFAKEPD